MNYLEQMFELQANLMKAYVEKGSLPNWPIDLLVRSNQQLIRDIIGYIIEEMSEAYTVLEEITLKLETNNRTDIEELVAKANEEYADVNHFWIELFIYSEITPEIIRKSIRKLGAVPNWISETEPLTLSLISSQLSLVSISNIHPGSLYQVNGLNEKLRIGSRLNRELLLDLSKMNWWVTHGLNKSRNLLKIKPWRDKGATLDMAKYQEMMLDTWAAYCMSLSLLDANAESLYALYKEKNNINWNRIKEGY